jgi:catechol 2,3-dioxygenase-like lactoylglutathione lyase family enzyme
MTVRRIVANIAAPDPHAAHAFYAGLLGLDVAMDMGFIVTFAAAPATARPQLSVMREGGSGAPVPDISVEVDDVDGYHRRALEAGFDVTYGPVDEPWGVRRFFVRDPFGRTLNVLAHAPTQPAA